MTVKIDGTNTVANPAFTGADTDTGLQCGTDELKLVTGGTARATVDSSGRLLVDTSSSRSVQDFAGNSPQGKIQIEAANSDATMSIISAGTSDSFRSATLSLGRHRNSTVGGTPTVVQGGDTLGAICFAGGDGTDMLTKGAHIAAQVDGTPGANDMPGRLIFATTADGASSPTERLRITSNGTLQLLNSPGIDFSGIQTNASGMTSETLDSYEEGTWTPTTASSHGTITTVGSTSGRYVKIGRLVTVHFIITITTAGTAAGAYLIFGNLPFTSANTHNIPGVCREQSVNGHLNAAQITGNATSGLILGRTNGGVIVDSGNYQCTITYEAQ